MASQLMFDIDTSPKLSRAGLTRSASSNIIPNYPVPYLASDSRSTWSVPASPVATINRQHVEPDIWSTSPTKRPSCISMASFTQSIVPVLSPFNIQRDKESFGEAVFGFNATSNDTSKGKDAESMDTYRTFSPYATPSDTFSPASPSLYSSSSMFPDLAISPPDLSTFPFCHFESMLSPSLVGRDPEFPVDEASGSVVSGCLLSGCHGHDSTHDQDGHPSPAVWSPSTLAAMRKRWRHMRKQPPAQTAVPPRPCLKKMSALAMDSFLSQDTTSSPSLESPHSGGESATDNFEALRFHLDFSEMVPGEWSLNGGNRSRSTSGASSTMLFSPFPSDLEDDAGLGSRTPEMALHVLQDDGLSEVEEYMLQGFLRAFSQPQHAPVAEISKPSTGEPLGDDTAEDLGSTPTPASVLAQQITDSNETIRTSPRSRPTISTALDVTPTTTRDVTPTTVTASSSWSVSHSDSLASIIHNVCPPDTRLPTAEPPLQTISLRSPNLDVDAEIDGEWQWACPITVPLPVRAGSSAAMVIMNADNATLKGDQRRAEAPSRSNSIISSATSKTCEKRRVHFPVCPGGNGEMALCALYPTYSATAYDRTPLEPPSEEERSCRMPDRFSRDLTDEDEFSYDARDQAPEHSLPVHAQSDLPEEASVDHSEWCASELSLESTAALDWSCSIDFMSDVAVQHASITDDNWEDWLDSRKSACAIASSTAALNATFEEHQHTEDLSTPTNTPLAYSPPASPSIEVAQRIIAYGVPTADAVSPTCSLQSLLEREAISSDALSHTTASSAGPSTYDSAGTSHHREATEVGIASERDESWLPHCGERTESAEVCNEEPTVKRTNSIPKLKKKKKAASAEKRTTLWTKTQPTWDQFGSDSWSTGEEGCLGGF